MRQGRPGATHFGRTYGGPPLVRQGRPCRTYERPRWWHLGVACGTTFALRKRFVYARMIVASVSFEAKISATKVVHCGPNKCDKQSPNTFGRCWSTMATWRKLGHESPQRVGVCGKPQHFVVGSLFVQRPGLVLPPTGSTKTPQSVKPQQAPLIA